MAPVHGTPFEEFMCRYWWLFAGFCVALFVVAIILIAVTNHPVDYSVFDSM